MSNWLCHAETIEVPTQAGVSIRDITPDLKRLVTESGIETGTLNATCIGSTGSLTTIEFEPGVVQDLERAINHDTSPRPRRIEITLLGMAGS